MIYDEKYIKMGKLFEEWFTPLMQEFGDKIISRKNDFIEKLMAEGSDLSMLVAYALKNESDEGFLKLVFTVMLNGK